MTSAVDSGCLFDYLAGCSLAAKTLMGTSQSCSRQNVLQCLEPIIIFVALLQPVSERIDLQTRRPASEIDFLLAAANNCKFWSRLSLPFKKP